MSWILRLIPFPFLLLITGLACGAGTVALVHFEFKKEAARTAGIPEAITASELGEYRAFPWFDEVAVQVQMHEDIAYVYWEDAVDGTVEFPIFFFFDPSQDGPVREVLGAIAFDSYEAEDMMAYLENVRVADGPIGGIFELVGVPPLFPYVTNDEVKWAAEDLGLTMAPNFLYLDPHFEGRDIRIAARPEFTYVAGVASVLLIWLSMIAAIVRRRWRRAAEANSLHGVAKKGLVAAAVGGVKMLASDEEDGNFI